MSHAQTGLVPADGSLLTIGWEQDWMHTANAATIAGCAAAQRFVSMAHCGISAMRRQKGFHYEKKM